MEENDDLVLGLDLGDGAHAEVLVLHQPAETGAGVQTSDHRQHTQDGAVGLNVLSQLGGAGEAARGRE